MNPKALMVIRIVFGLALAFFGTNHLFHYVSPPSPPLMAIPFWKALEAANIIALVGIVETVAAVSLLLNKYTALTMVALYAISVGVVVYHLSLDMAALPMGLGLFILNVVMLYANKDKYKELLKA